ncbi:MAG: hypothetical protein EXS63_07235 [Candidatus Omnitrophica bacterium]|nr:hypothetical protein [Candidatus Omnitrophota bacterium]
MNAPIVTMEERKREGFGWIPAQAESIPERICFEEWFGNDHPVEVELGCGKGKFLLARAQANSKINFIGIDWSRKWLSIGAERSVGQEISHVKWVWGRVSVLLARIPSQSISIFHIYFPDPWPKRKHQERRLICAELIDELQGLLKPGGRIEIATDFQDYFEAIKKSVGRVQTNWSRLRMSMNERLFSPDIKTSYEIKYEACGKPLYYMELVKGI